ncbi:recombination protein NinB [Aromatoleum evansii]|uniref:Recombination protein NinB n=1 Tax=Aromatoleum evansii TaxID=59406 RepID=A0ABZ1AW57_AROEV|nr:recombination protein NinB [Aromatoleum evansii]WRL48343.1 recombination protein NinB [Aromatoleum evansii]
MTALYREFVLRAPDSAKALVAFLKQNAGAAVDSGRPLRVIVTDDEKKRNSEQNKRLWKAVYEQIAAQAWVNGRQFSKDVWHEWFADKHMPKTEFVMPDGEIRSRRKSTAELTVSEFSEYMNTVEAEAATELGVIFHE